MKRLLPLLCGVLVLSTVLFGVLWQREAHSHRELEQLWISAAAHASQQLSDYQQTGESLLLTQAAADLHVMHCAAGQLDTSSAAYADLNAVCSLLLADPLQGSTLLSDWMDVMDLAVEEGLVSQGPNWPIRLNELRHALEGAA
ncbi:MAG TPA: hypothetical protein H9841_03170 [Candidatus Flavonifractor merdigallinarum]|uniref:Uncharacterized protein n=1 Tax=Candidatus Flavonifractor merdigallinarum TaxID=2838589 RepID=A0A9D1Y7G9_9FIRM|nr:hypothetical protein [Candidatus Flavonifractor merdigallinarum]